MLPNFQGTQFFADWQSQTSKLPLAFIIIKKIFCKLKIVEVRVAILEKLVPYVLSAVPTSEEEFNVCGLVCPIYTDGCIYHC